MGRKAGAGWGEGEGMDREKVLCRDQFVPFLRVGFWRSPLAREGDITLHYIGYKQLLLYMQQSTYRHVVLEVSHTLRHHATFIKFNI